MMLKIGQSGMKASIKMDRWYKRFFIKAMYFLRVWKLPLYGRGEFSKNGIHVAKFEHSNDRIKKYFKELENIEKRRIRIHQMREELNSPFV